MRSLLLSLLLIFSGSVLAQSPSSVFSNKKGVEELKKSNPSAAQEKFLQALSKNPFQAELHLNLGVTFEALGQMDKAQASYQTALKLAKNDLVKFTAHFNLGALAQKAKKVDEALQSYQEALKINPTSEETKINIELLTQDQKGKGKGEGDQKDPKDKSDEGQGEGKDPKEDQEKKDQEKEGEKDKPKEYSKSKPQPQKFKSEELSQGDVNKILGEIKQQEQKIRAEFNKKESKDKPRDKDW